VRAGASQLSRGLLDLHGFAVSAGEVRSSVVDALGSCELLDRARRRTSSRGRDPSKRLEVVGVMSIL
jgi:hypothetical protein